MPNATSSETLSHKQTSTLNIDTDSAARGATLVSILLYEKQKTPVVIPVCGPPQQL